MEANQTKNNPMAALKPQASLQVNKEIYFIGWFALLMHWH
jgi:hypothetical protein